MIGRDVQEACWLVESVDHSLATLEVFSSKAMQATELLRQKIELYCDGGLDERDKFKVDFYKSLIKHLQKLHNG